MLPQEGNASVPPATVTPPDAVIAPTLTVPETVRFEPAARTTLLPLIQGVGAPLARCQMPLAQLPLPDQ